MANTTPEWVGNAKKVNQIATILVGSNTNTHTFIVNLKAPAGVGDVVAMTTVTADGVLTTAQLATNIQTAMAAHAHEWAKAITWTVNSSTVTATANVAGVPFMLTVTGTGTSTVTVTTANSGPNDWRVPGNWSHGAIPVTGDQVTISGSSSILYGLDQSAVSDITSLDIRRFTGQIGTFATPLYIDVATKLEMDAPSGKAYIQLQNVTTDIIVFNTGGNENDPGLTFVNNLSAATRFRMLGGSVYLTPTSTVPAITTLSIDGGNMLIDGSTVTTVNQTGGNLNTINLSAITTHNIDSGTFTAQNQSSTGTVNQNGGVVSFAPTVSLTVTAWNLRGGTLDLTNARHALTITTLTMRQAGILLMDSSIVTVTTFTREGVFRYQAA